MEKKLIELIMYADDLNCNVVDEELMKESVKLQNEIYDAMCDGIDQEEALGLLEQYEEINNELHQAEDEHWFKVGLKTGFAICQILNEE